MHFCTFSLVWIKKAPSLWFSYDDEAFGKINLTWKTFSVFESEGCEAAGVDWQQHWCKECWSKTRQVPLQSWRSQIIYLMTVSSPTSLSFTYGAFPLHMPVVCYIHRKIKNTITSFLSYGHNVITSGYQIWPLLPFTGENSSSCP